MLKYSLTPRALIATGGGLIVASTALLAFAAPSFSAATSAPPSTSAAATASTPPKPSPNCKVPVFSVSPLKAKPGTVVSVSGQNFSGCKALGNTATPTPVLTVQIGVETASKMGVVLTTTHTSATGAFQATITVPPLAADGVPKLALAALAKDPATGLSYAGVAVLAYDVTSSTPTTPVSSGDGSVPTAVPAGTGGQAGSTSTTTRVEQGAVGAAGVVLVAAGLGLTRRRRRSH